MKKLNLVPLVLISTLLASCQGSATKWDAKHAFEDDTLKYCLLIGQIDHNDSAARTGGIREALHTRPTATTNANNETPIEGTLDLNGHSYKVQEIEHGEQKTDGGATWDQQKATSSTQAWFNSHGSDIDFIVSNNDGMAEGAIGASNYIEGTPIFGYDSNASTLEFIKQGKIMGTINQNASAQVAGILMLVRNILDGSTNPTAEGFSEEAKNGYGKISANFTYNDSDKSLLVDNFAVTADNVDQYLGKTPAQLVDTNVKKGTTGTKSVWMNYYSSSDTFLNSTVKPLVAAYKGLFNLNVTDNYSGDGNSDSSITNNLNTKSDAYVINTVKTTSAKAYLDKIAQIPNIDKEGDKITAPVIFYNRQPTDQNNLVDTNVMTDSRFKSIYYVGFDAVQGGKAQGEMIVNYLKAQEKTAKEA